MARKRNAGFSLIELMIAIAVLGIIVTWAVSTYGSSTIKSRRGTAKACLMEVAQFMERNYTLKMTYDVDDFPELACAGELSDHYAFDFVGTPDGDSYEIEAAPVGGQADDTLCGTLTIDQSGVKGANDVEACW